MPLHLYNTLTRKKQEFHPLRDNKVGLYACGPTVYHFAHIGNFRSYVTWDVLRRVLERNHYKVTHVMNITDVGHLQGDADDTEDKMEKTAREEKKSPWEIAKFYTKAFLDDMEKLNLKKPTIICRATDHIPEMVRLIQRLEKKGFTYRTKNAVHFDVQKFPGYGKFARISLDQLKGTREGVVRDPGKKHPADFRLWQLNQPHHAMQWDSPWGKGYPGWHIECSAMSMKYLGPTLDIHTGGMDNIFPHHQNEIAQSEAATGKHYVNYWLHATFNLVNNQKMSKSLKNIYTLADLEKKGFSPMDFRYLLLTTHYRSELNFTFDALEASQKTLEKWNEFIRRLQKYASKSKPNPEMKEKIKDAKTKFDDFLNDDLNTPQALAVLSDFQREINGRMEKGEMSKSDARAVLEFLKKANEVLQVFDFAQNETPVPAHVLKLAQEREKARRAKEWKKADELRKEIEKEGYLITDSKEGFEIRLANK